MKLKSAFLLTSFILLSGFGYANEEVTIRQFRPDHRIITVKITENEVQFNSTKKKVESGTVDLKKIPTAPSDSPCLPEDRWLVTQAGVKKEYCKNQVAIAALQKIFTQVKIITR